MRSVTSLEARLVKVAEKRRITRGRIESVSEGDRAVRAMQMYAAGVPRLVELMDRARDRRDSKTPHRSCS